MNNPLRIALAGLGTVGGGVAAILERQATLLEARCGRAIRLVAVSARDRTKPRPFALDGIRWMEDPVALASLPEADVIVELMGGHEGAARALVEAALKAGKPVVTANKALIAHHGTKLAALAEKANVAFGYEAAVAGGIPVIKTLREGLAANEYRQIAGILNGTCNYILSTMWETKRDFTDVLAEAQRLGYAEADPSFDVDGIDTAHKLAIVASLAYGMKPDINSVQVEGIRHITIRDMEFADELGYAIKLLGLASRSEEGVLQRVHPCMVPKLSPIGRVGGAYNGVILEGDAVGRVILEGPGAGAGPTASAVVSDLMDIARGNKVMPFIVPVAQLDDLPAAPMEQLRASYYMRLAVVDRPGVLASITGIFRDENISLHSFLQRSHTPGEPVQVVLVTHATREREMKRAQAAIGAQGFVLEPLHVIRIEDF